MDKRFYCVHEHRHCDEVFNCVYRADNNECMLRTATIRKLGTMKRIQQTMLWIGKVVGVPARALMRIWRDPHERVSSHDSKYADKADRD